jgi:hypothetical protein
MLFTIFDEPKLYVLHICHPRQHRPEANIKGVVCGAFGFPCRLWLSGEFHPDFDMISRKTNDIYCETFSNAAEEI